jgi:AraC-like DNA-binding protein
MYREYPPEPDLFGHVACTWTRSVGPQLAGVLDPIIPDGCVDVIAFDDGVPFVAGPATETQWHAQASGRIITGIRFLPGAARDILHVEIDRLCNRSVDLVDVCDGQGHALGRALDEASTAAMKRLALERWTRQQRDAGRGRDAVVIAAARALARQGATIDALARDLGWTTRRVHRQFVSACGYGPKVLQRVLRLQRAIHAADGSSTGSISLTQLAAVAGYADQAHMTREFRVLTSFTPRDYLSSARPRVWTWLDSNR